MVAKSEILHSIVKEHFYQAIFELFLQKLEILKNKKHESLKNRQKFSRFFFDFFLVNLIFKNWKSFAKTYFIHTWRMTNSFKHSNLLRTDLLCTIVYFQSALAWMKISSIYQFQFLRCSWNVCLLIIQNYLKLGNSC